MAPIDDLVARQSQYIGSIKRALINFKKMGQAKMTPAVTRQRLALLKENFTKCQELDAEILVAADDKTRSSHPYFTEEQFLMCEEAFHAAADFMAETIANAEPSNADLNAAVAAEVHHRATSRLPQLRLPSFDGNFDQWEAFRDKFTSLIIHDLSLRNVDRMHYLSSCLTGEAATALSHLSITEANFAIAWKIISSRYENKRRLISLHIDKLHNLPEVNSEAFAELRDLRDKTNASLQALRNLDRPVDEWSDLLVYLVTRKLDPVTRKAWEIQLGDSVEYPSFELLSRFVDSRIRALESMPEKCKDKVAVKAPPLPRVERTKSVATHSATITSACPVCRAPHLIYQCDQFRNQSPAQRYSTIKGFKRCVNCFSAKHVVKDCPSARVCKQCQKKHHTLLHFAGSTRQGSIDAPVTGTPAIDVTDTHAATHLVSQTATASVPVLLATARVRVYSPRGNFVRARALLDQGSATSIVTENLVQLLQLTKMRRSIRVSGVGDTSQTVRHAVKLAFTPVDASDPVFSTTALVIKTLTRYIPERFNSGHQWPHLEHLELADRDPMSSDPIDILIGADLYGSILLEGVRKGLADQPIAQNTSLGWVLSGPLHAQSSPRTSPSLHTTLDTLDCDLRRFWAIEDIPKTHFLSPEERQCEEHFASTHSRTLEGRYVVRLPFKLDPVRHLGESRSAATARLIQLERRLSREPTQQAAYSGFLAEYLQLKHMEPASPIAPPDSPRYYIPHHAVCKADSDTTPLRVVFNASCRTSTGNSLNDCLLIGPKLQNDLPSILIRWRQCRYVYIADSAKMYRQILLDSRDRDFQRILWRFSPTDPIAEYRLCTVTYGTAPAAYQAQRVIQQLATDEGHAYPLALPVVQDQMYVDDVIFGADDLQLARHTRDQLISLLEKGGFRLRKWASNCRRLLDGIDPAEHGLAREKPLRADDCVKVLGVSWHPESDTLQFRARVPHEPGSTKRDILSLIAKLFDPLGLVTPVVITAKILMQKLWSTSCGWDDNLSPELLREWEGFYSKLPALDQVTVPRWTHRAADTLHYSLHGFADASSHAYAAVVYGRVYSVDKTVFISLLAAKSKVAPVKTLSIPRLELMAALLLSRLISSIRSALTFQDLECHCWTDSTIVQAWLRQSPSHWKTFVANRVAEIQSNIPDATWHHVRTEENPADCASRGLPAPELPLHKLWWEGPAWLFLPPTEWPASPSEPASPCLEEKRREVHAHSMACLTSCPWADRFSSWPKLLRVTAYIFRAAKRLRANVGSRLPLDDSLPASSGHVNLFRDEIQRARIHLLRSMQSDVLPTEVECLSKGQPVSKTSSIAALHPFLDSDKLIRVGGRLDKSQLPEKSKHPIVLCSHFISTLIISHHHLRTLHGGPSLTLASLRDEFWLLRARATVRAVLHRCTVCAREKAAVPTELMGSLPAVRTTRSVRAFVHTGVDYAGPIAVRNAAGRGQKSHKAYIALFICMSTKAIHLELVHDYGSSAFLAAFQRFSSRRGLPASMYSDNGTTFQGADRELTAAYRAATRDPNTVNALAVDSVAWHFLPPAAPHFGGLWEAGVRRVKHHLKRCIGSHTLTGEEMNTLLCRIEACLNSRPLAAVSEHIEDYNALTPGHFLIGAPLIAIPESSLLELSETRLSRWQLVQRIAEGFWKLWTREYLHTLQQRPKWRVVQRLAKIGRLVLLRNPSLPPCQWELGRIVDCHPGEDGLVRVVTVKTSRSTYTRPIVKLCFLPVDINEEDGREGSTAGGAATSDNPP